MTEVVEKKKRGRKPKSDKNVVSEGVKESSKTDSQILHLNITRNSPDEDFSSSLVAGEEIYEKNYCNYTPELNEPNAYNENDNFISKPYELANKDCQEQCSDNTKLTITNIDKHTCISKVCYWCCHSFEHTPMGLPLKYKNDVFHVTGCFCSFECICAYIFYSNENNHNIWETYNLINIMTNKLDYDVQVYPAPPRKCLKMFGGYMDIDEFRNFRNSKKIVNVNQVPYVVNIEQIEEINDFNHRNTIRTYKFDEERIENLEKKLDMIKKKNIKDNYKNTLDSCMNISN